MRPTKCHGNEHHVEHAAGCRRGRPLCRWRRKTNHKRCKCSCDAYWFPHRAGSGACRDGLPFALTERYGSLRRRAG